MLAVARNLRQERDREHNISQQKHDQKNLVGFYFSMFKEGSSVYLMAIILGSEQKYRIFNENTVLLQCV